MTVAIAGQPKNLEALIKNVRSPLYPVHNIRCASKEKNHNLLECNVWLLIKERAFRSGATWSTQKKALVRPLLRSSLKSLARIRSAAARCN